MKTINNFFERIKLLPFVLVLIVAGAVGCKKETNPPVKNCQNEARFVFVEGAGGYYSNYTIVLNDDQTILPYEVEDKSISPSEVYDGMPITVTYTILPTDAVDGGISGILPGGCVVWSVAKVTCLSKKTQEQPTGWCGTH